MPGLSGLEVLRTLKSDPATVSIPVVICTSVEAPEFHQQARSSGALAVLPGIAGMGGGAILIGVLYAPGLTPTPTVPLQLGNASGSHGRSTTAVE